MISSRFRFPLAVFIIIFSLQPFFPGFSLHNLYPQLKISPNPPHLFLCFFLFCFAKKREREGQAPPEKGGEKKPEKKKAEAKPAPSGLFCFFFLPFYPFPPLSSIFVPQSLIGGGEGGAGGASFLLFFFCLLFTPPSPPLKE